MGIAVQRGLSVILIALVVAGSLCALDGHEAGVDLCFLLLAVTPVAVSFIRLVLVGRVVLPPRRRPWLLPCPASPAPI